MIFGSAFAIFDISFFVFSKDVVINKLSGINSDWTANMSLSLMMLFLCFTLSGCFCPPLFSSNYDKSFYSMF